MQIEASPLYYLILSPNRQKRALGFPATAQYLPNFSRDHGKRSSKFGSKVCMNQKHECRWRTPYVGKNGIWFHFKYQLVRQKSGTWSRVRIDKFFLQIFIFLRVFVISFCMWKKCRAPINSISIWVRNESSPGKLNSLSVCLRAWEFWTFYNLLFLAFFSARIVVKKLQFSARRVISIVPSICICIREYFLCNIVWWAGSFFTIGYTETCLQITPSMPTLPQKYFYF